MPRRIQKTAALTFSIALALTGCAGSSSSTAPTAMAGNKMLITNLGATTDSIGTIASDGTGRAALLGSGTDSPAISQNRLKIAYSKVVSGKDQIFIANIDGSGATQLSDGAFKDGHPSFSADGMKIVFVRDIDGAGDTQIFSIPVSGGAVTQITAPIGSTTFPHNFDPALSPDGTKIAFWRSASGGSGPIMVANADGSNPIAISAVGGSVPAWSPDGTKIAFAIGGVIKVMNPDGSGLITVSTGTSNNRPTWSPDGTQIAFDTARSADAFTLQIYRVPAAGGTETPVTSDQANPAYVPRWSRN